MSRFPGLASPMLDGFDVRLLPASELGAVAKELERSARLIGAEHPLLSQKMAERAAEIRGGVRT